MAGPTGSHGCVRISPANAATLYRLVQQEGASITIVGEPPAGPIWASAGEAAPGAGGAPPWRQARPRIERQSTRAGVRRDILALGAFGAGETAAAAPVLRASELAALRRLDDEGVTRNGADYCAPEKRLTKSPNARDGCP